jgi:hypothetical protein
LHRQDAEKPLPPQEWVQFTPANISWPAGFPWPVCVPIGLFTSCPRWLP